MAIETRIIGLSYDDPATLIANPHNYRIHPDNQRTALSASLTELGWIDTVIVNDTTGHIVDGHLRVEDALTLNEQTIPVLHVLLSEDEERAALMTLDPLSALAINDAAALHALRMLTETDNADLSALWDSIAPDSIPQPTNDADLDGEIETEHECPSCGYRWNGAAVKVRVHS
jgi:hypothetical protein